MYHLDMYLANFKTFYLGTNWPQLQMSSMIR